MRHFARLHFDEGDQRDHAAIDQRGEQAEDKEEAKQARQESLQIDLTLCVNLVDGTPIFPPPLLGEGEGKRRINLVDADH